MRPREEIASLEICPHGGPDYAELKLLGLEPEEVLDFSVSANPFGPPPGAKEALTSAVIDRYPDSESSQLRRSLAAHLRTNSENIIAGNGSTEIIRLIASAYISGNEPVIIVEPTFGEYEIACQIAGARILSHRTQASNNFKLNTDELAASIKTLQPKAVFLCNPNNPTGQYSSRDKVVQIISACQNSLFVLDEAYVSFAEESWDSLNLIEEGNLIIIRSMTKDYALAGLRLGYAIAHTEIIETLKRVCPPWNVNAAAQQVGLAALSEQDYLNRCKDDILKAKGFLIEKLTGLGLNPLPSHANFFLVNVGDATEFRRKLLRHGIMVRDCTSFGLPQYIRIAPRTMPECEKLIEISKQVSQ
ncbi:MAG: histidinol-phosphate transaminase [Dehalococcoidia bacterium]